VKSITKSLSDIALLMNEGDKFLVLRFTCEKWEQEANEGNKDSAALIEVIKQFERLINAVTKIHKPEEPELSTTHHLLPSPKGGGFPCRTKMKNKQQKRQRPKFNNCEICRKNKGPIIGSNNTYSQECIRAFKEEDSRHYSVPCHHGQFYPKENKMHEWSITPSSEDKGYCGPY